MNNSVQYHNVFLNDNTEKEDRMSSSTLSMSIQSTPLSRQTSSQSNKSSQLSSNLMEFVNQTPQKQGSQ